MANESQTRVKLKKSYSSPASRSVTIRPSLNRSLSRVQTFRGQIQSGAATFFGLPRPDAAAEEEDVEQRRWTNRRLRHCSRRYGLRRPAVVVGDDIEMTDSIYDSPATGGIPRSFTNSMAGTPYAASGGGYPHHSAGRRGSELTASIHGGSARSLGRSLSIESRSLVATRPALVRRESVARMAMDKIVEVVKASTPSARRPRSNRLVGRQLSRSFAPSSVCGLDDASPGDMTFSGAGGSYHPGPSSIPSAPHSAAIMGGGFASNTIPGAGAVSRRPYWSPMVAESEPIPIPTALPAFTPQGSDATVILEPQMETISEAPESPMNARQSSGAEDSGVDAAFGRKKPPLAEAAMSVSASKAFTTVGDLPPSSPSAISDYDDVFFDFSPGTAAGLPGFPPVAYYDLPAYSAAGQPPLTATSYGDSSVFTGPPSGGKLPATGSMSLPTGAPVSAGPVFTPSSRVGSDGRVNHVFQYSYPPDTFDSIHYRRPVLKTDSGDDVFLPETIVRSREIQLVETVPKFTKRPGKIRKSPTKQDLLTDRTKRPAISRLISKALSNSDRRRYGEGFIWRLFGRRLKRKSELSAEVRKQLDDWDDYRPYFTYWVTSVQVVVLLASVILYGFGPVGFGRRQFSSMVLHTSLVLQQVAYFEQENFWLGPRYADLVHLGAKYSPCMRRDQKINDVIMANRARENQSACCIWNDGTGCVQATERHCSDILSTWKVWNKDNPGPDGPNGPRTSGPVCGQDPSECLDPPSSAPYEWPNDIVDWPICRKAQSNSYLDHMRCEITGRPCCIGIQGECRITTREYCDFVNGYFHDEAFLCAQVSCLNEVCGMVPFVNKDHPDQFSRLFVSLFLHAGLIHCLCTVFIQYFLMRDLEKLIGWARLAIIYLGAGIAGNLASAIFVPYQAEVGPAGSHFGLLAALFVDAFYSWELIRQPWKAFLQLFAFILVLFFLGLLPWIDNWAHFFGFLFGGFLALAVFPFINFGAADRRRRVIIVVIALVFAIGLFVMLILMFYVNPLWNCPNCVWFNCIKLSDHFCDNQGLELDLLPI